MDCEGVSQNCGNCDYRKEDPEEVDGGHTNVCTYALVPSCVGIESKYNQRGYAYLDIGFTSNIEELGQGQSCKVWKLKQPTKRDSHVSQ